MTQKTITRENLNQQINEAVNELLHMADEYSWNKISRRLKFVIKKINSELNNCDNFLDRNRLRKKILEQKERLNLDKAIKHLISEYENIYLIELYIFKACRNETIIEIEILEKTQLDIEYRKTILDKPPMLHCKVAIPPYIKLESKDKFDINWQLETLEYKWKMFWLNRNNKTLKLLLICLLIFGCSSNEYFDNQNIKASIDLLKISNTVIELETDSIGNVLDTIAIVYLKLDQHNRKRFKKRIHWYNDRKRSWIDYFKINEDLFYREVFDEEGNSNSIFETISNIKGEVVKAFQISKENEPFDTISMDYSHEYYKNGKVKKLLIKAFYKEFGESTSIVEYDKHENPLFEVLFMNKDTTSFQFWEYSDTKMIRSTFTSYQGDTTKYIYSFEGKEKLINEEKFRFKNGRFFKSEEIKHLYNQSNERQKSIKRNLEKDEVKHIKYLRIK